MAMRDTGSHAPRLKAMGRPKALGNRPSGRAGESAAGESVRASGSLDDVPHCTRLPSYPPVGPADRLPDLYRSLSALLGIIFEPKDMPDTEAVTAAKSGEPGCLPWLSIFAFWALVQALVRSVGASPVLEGGLIGTDGYMRLVRVELLQETGAGVDGAGRLARASGRAVPPVPGAPVTKAPRAALTGEPAFKAGSPSPLHCAKSAKTRNPAARPLKKPFRRRGTRPAPCPR